MSKYSICIIDDKIPAARFAVFMDEKKILNRNNFEHLLKYEKIWEELQLFNLVKKLFEKPDNYEITGFTNHSFFFNYIEEDIFSPDIVIFDWEVGETNPKQNLLELLQKKYCLIAVYTGEDNKEEVNSVINGEEFADYKERLFIQIKGEDKSVEKLETQISERLKLFSFKLNQTIKKNTLQSIDNILIKIGKLSFNQFVSLFGEDDNGQKKISQPDFIDIFLEKLKFELTSIGLDDVELKANHANIEDTNKIRELWHYRMYHKTNDNIIRKGDILKKDNDYFLVLSSDCHLNEFWNKSLGYLMLVKLHLVDKNNDNFKKRLNYRKNENLTKYRLNSLVSPTKIDFLTILPSLVFNGNNYYDYALNPRELSSMEIGLPVNNNTRQKLLIEHIVGYEKYLSVSEPFMSTLFLFISQHFSGYGLPDFSEKLRDSISENISKLKKEN